MRFFISIIISLGMCLNAYAGIPPPLSKVIFVADYRDGLLNADKSGGSSTATFAASRDATHPATYFDSSGVMQVTTTSNVGRFNYGYYNTTGYNAFTHAGFIPEGASTNYLTYGIFSAGATLGTGWTDSHTTDSIVTYSLVDVKSTFNVGTTVQAQRIVYTGVAADVSAYSIIDQSTAAASFAQADNVTVSCWIKGSSSGLQIALSYDEYNNVPAYLSSNNGSNIAGDISSTEWRRFTYLHAADEATCDRIHPRVIVTNIDDGDTVDIQVANIQVEKLPFASSFIPTTTAALTRNAETLKYVNAGNRSAAVESCVIKFAPEWNGTDLAAGVYLMDTDTKARYAYGTTDDFIHFSPNSTDSAGATVASTSKPSANTEYTIGLVCQSTGNPNSTIYYNGISEATHNTDFTANAWGTYFWVGSLAAGSNQLYGTIFSIAFFDRVLNASEMKVLHDVDWEPKVFHKGGMGKEGLGGSYKPQINLR